MAPVTHETRVLLQAEVQLEGGSLLLLSCLAALRVQHLCVLLLQLQVKGSVTTEYSSETLAEGCTPSGWSAPEPSGGPGLQL